MFNLCFHLEQAFLVVVLQLPYFPYHNGYWICLEFQDHYDNICKSKILLRNLLFCEFKRLLQLFFQNDHCHPHQSSTHQYGHPASFLSFLLITVFSFSSSTSNILTETFWLSSSNVSVSLSAGNLIPSKWKSSSIKVLWVSFSIHFMRTTPNSILKTFIIFILNVNTCFL